MERPKSPRDVAYTDNETDMRYASDGLEKKETSKDANGSLNIYFSALNLFQLLNQIEDHTRYKEMDLSLFFFVVPVVMYSLEEEIEIRADLAKLLFFYLND